MFKAIATAFRMSYHEIREKITWRMKMKKRNQTGKSGVAAAGGKMWALMLCLALFTGLLTGCGGKNGQGNGQNNGEEQVKTETLTVKGDEYYELTIKPIPNANRNIGSTLPPDGVLQDGWEGMEGSFSCVGTTVYRICSSWNVDESTGQQVFGRDKQYVQYLEEPYEEWVDLPVSQEAWQQDVIWSAHQFRVDEDNRMFILLSSWNAADEQLEYAIGELYRDGRQVLIQQGLEEEQAILLMDSQGGEAEPLVYDQMYAVAKGSDIATAHDDAGDLYFGTKQKVWHYNGKETIEVLDFREQDVALKSLINMAVVENGFLFLGSFGEQYYLVEAQRVEEPVIVEKQEIVLADSYVGEELQDAVAGFNMQSREYRVVIRQATGLTEEEKEKFQREIQLELVEGAGPDILGMYDAIPDMVGYARKGSLLSLDDLFGGKTSMQMDQFMETPMKGGIWNGKRYGLPYGMVLDFMVIDGEKSDGITSWNARELMQYVKQSGARYMQFPRYNNPTASGNLYSLMRDTEDTTYIDWQQGISHLSEQPFIDLLEFSLQYSVGDDQFTYEEAGGMIKNGEFAIFTTNMHDNLDVLFLEKLFQGNPNYVGYPSVSGNGVGVTPVMLYVNAKTEHKDGVYAFLEYLLSDAGQMNCFTVTYPDLMPVRKDSFQWMLESGPDGTPRGRATYGLMGETFRRQPLTTEQKEQVMYMLEHATITNYALNEIWEIIQEETEPFFQGDKSAKEVADILHNRVQLYLNERK